jgi:translation initiation factor 5
MATIYLATKDSSLSDPSYRYQIDNLDIKVIGKQGNMTTYFINSEYIAKKIDRDSALFGKYISNSIGCPSKFDKEKDCLTFKGNYTHEQILKYFTEFVQQYVLCNECDLPEINIYNNKGKGIYFNCKSCGKTDALKAKIDKTYDFIEKNLK